MLKDKIEYLLFRKKVKLPALKGGGSEVRQCFAAGALRSKSGYLNIKTVKPALLVSYH
jgi:hypothetical protein